MSEEKRELRGDQPQAFGEISTWLSMSGGGMYLLQGGAGVGKSFLLKDIVKLIELKGRPLITACTHKAVKVIKHFCGPDLKYSTIHAALGMKEFIDDEGKLSFRRDPMAGHPASDYTHIIVDESSMIQDVIFYDLVDLSLQGKKILFVGDSLQIPPVGYEYALPFEKTVRQEYNIGVSSLETIIRQAENHPIISLATDIRTQVHKPIQILQRSRVKNEIGEVLFIEKGKDTSFFIQNILPYYKSSFYQKDIDHIKVVAWRNKTVAKYNSMIRGYLFGENLPKIIVGDKLIADAPVIEEKKILISTNEEMEVLGVDLSEEVLSEDYTLKYYRTRVRVFQKGLFDEFMLRILHEDSEETYENLCRMQANLAKSYPKGTYNAKSAWADLYGFKEHWHQVKYSYAITAHRSQGSTYHTAYVLEWDIKTNPIVFERNRIFYTACTRPSKNLFVVY